jgi:hypothetical protein
MLKKIFLLSSFFLSCFICFSQGKLFEDYYTEARTFISNFKTYKIIIVKGDTSFTPRYNDQRNQLRIVFPFLHKMSEVKNNPDIVIRIIIKDSNLRVNYTLLNSSGNQDQYQLRWLGNLKFIIQFSADNKESITIPLCDFMHYENYVSNYDNGRLTLKSSSYGSTADPNSLKWNDINFWVSMSEEYLRMKADFRKEFVSALKAFSKDKCE